MSAPVDKIQKLLRLERGGTPGEAANARRAAQTLATRHGINLAAVDPDREPPAPASAVAIIKRDRQPAAGTAKRDSELSAARQAGRLSGYDEEPRCPYSRADLVSAWLEGRDAVRAERAESAQPKPTPEQRAESSRVAAMLKQWADDQFTERKLITG